VATCNRVLVKIDETSRKPIQVSEKERLRTYVVDDDASGEERFNHSIPALTRWDMDQESWRNHSLLPVLLRVRVGPQHINHFDHCDHAFLAETASHSLSIIASTTQERVEPSAPSTLCVQYVTPGFLGQEIECRVDGSGGMVTLWGHPKTRIEGNSARELLVIAEQS